MKLKTLYTEPQVQITFTQSELVWLQVLLDNILNNDNLDGWKPEARKLLGILRSVKVEGEKMLPTTEAFENSEMKFIK